MLAWIDTETTGLSPKIDKLLEFALVLTRDDLSVIASTSVTFSASCYIEEDQTGIVTIGDDTLFVNEWVAKTHYNSGLWADCADATLNDPSELYAYLTGWLAGAHIAPLADVKKAPLCGSSIHFDRGFLAEHCPDVHDMFSYRSVDVSSFLETAKRFDPVFQGSLDRAKVEPSHRAMDDILASLEHYKKYIAQWMPDTPTAGLKARA